MAPQPCFLSGTRIRTPSGETAVEALAPGDAVLSISGAAVAVRWIGRRAYDARFIANHPEAFPVLVRRGALGEDCPRRDLYLSGEHALWIDGALVAAALLSNGVSIGRLRQWSGPLEYYHVELEQHDVLMAEGAAAESYLDCGNRDQFQNAADFRRLYPQFRISDQVEWSRRLVSGPALEAIRERLRARAATLPAGEQSAAV